MVKCRGVTKPRFWDWGDASEVVDHGEPWRNWFFGHNSTLAPKLREWDRGTMPLQIKRVYEEPAREDGYRVLVDRIWPRGVSKAKAHVEVWLKGVGPSTELRKWFNHEDAKWREFQTRYKAELDQHPDVAVLREIISEHDVVTLVYSAHNESENQAAVLRDYLG